MRNNPIKNLEQNEKRDLHKIIKLLHDYDHSRNGEVKQAGEHIVRKGISFESSYGKSYIERVRNIISDDEQSRQCLVCCKKGAKNRIICVDCMKKLEGIDLNPVNHLVDKVDDLLDGDGYVKLRWKDLFSDVFKKHTTDEAENIFICGTAKTTPKESEMSGEWPKPWLYSRVALVLFFAFLFLMISVGIFGNSTSVPGLIFIGSLLIPLSVLILFFEMNAPRNISIFKVISVFFVGGCASIFVSLIFYSIVPLSAEDNISVITGFAVGIIEELGKLIAAAYFINRLKNKKYLLNGLLIGASVGAGFAVFESAGYAFAGMIPSVEQIIDIGEIEYDVLGAFFTMVLRGILSPGNHIVWTAMAGYAVVKVMNKYKTMPQVEKQDKGTNKKSNLLFGRKMFFTKEFLSIFIIPVLLHALWDITFSVLNITKCNLLVIVAWIIMFVFIDNGLDEINIITREKMYSE